VAVEKVFKYVLVLPLVENIHQTLVAFLSTSEQGNWIADPLTASTPYVLHVMRGNWKRAWLGLSQALTPGYCDVDGKGINIPESRPMKLKIMIRPSPIDIRLTLLFSVFSVVSFAEPENTQHAAYWSARTGDEVQNMREYLRTCYGLPSPPLCENR